MECLEPNFDRRLACILDIAEATSRFLSALVLCQGAPHTIEPLWDPDRYARKQVPAGCTDESFTLTGCVIYP
ncbi:MAG: hypothetical protein ACREWG_08235 [Gammaproteobacteria bacterium]